MRIVDAVLPAQSASPLPKAASRSSAAKCPPHGRPQTGDRSRFASSQLVPRPTDSAKAASRASTDTVPLRPSSSAGKRAEGTRCVVIPAASASPTPIALRSAHNKRRFRPAYAAETRSRRHREKSRCRPPAWRRKAIAGNAMRAVHRNADAAAHDDAVDQRHVRLAEALDRGIERVFVAPELKRLVITAGLAKFGKARGCRRRRKRRGRPPPSRRLGQCPHRAPRHRVVPASATPYRA